MKNENATVFLLVAMADGAITRQRVVDIAQTKSNVTSNMAHQNLQVIPADVSIIDSITSGGTEKKNLILLQPPVSINKTKCGCKAYKVTDIWPALEK